MLDWLSVLSLAGLFTGLVVGGMALFTFVLAPGVFAHLDKEPAGGLMAALFPQYYLAMALAGIGAAGALVVDGLHGLEVVCMAGVAFGFIAARRGLLPRMANVRVKARQGDEAARLAYRRLHGGSMILNLAQLLVAAFVLLRITG